MSRTILSHALLFLWEYSEPGSLSQQMDEHLNINTRIFKIGKAVNEKTPGDPFLAAVVTKTDGCWTSVTLPLSRYKHESRYVIQIWTRIHKTI